MNGEQKITLGSVLSEGLGIGVKNAVSIVVATVLWLLTIWIPYLNVGTTIAMTTIPIELSKGQIISPLFIFDGKYRQYMGEYFTLIGLMLIALIPAFLFMIVPGIIIGIGWSLALYILLDKGIAPGAALVRSNKATYGYKWTIFLVGAVLYVVYWIGMTIFSLIPFIGIVLVFLLSLVYVVAQMGCSAVIYRELVSDEPEQAKAEEQMEA